VSGPIAHAGPAASGSPVADGAGARVAVLAAAFNGDVVERLAEGAVSALVEAGVAPDDVVLRWVPGAFELPLAARSAAASGRFDAIVALGAVIRGETSHFDFVAGQAARGLQEVALSTGVPVSFGVLTTDTVEQALERAGGSLGNKGTDASLAALQMVKVLDDFR
jgi:6,7-dimethyl-8-ribityllumazine synthase